MRYFIGKINVFGSVDEVKLISFIVVCFVV